MKPETIIIEKTYPAPIHKVWDAITNINKLKEWYFPLSDFKPEVGFEYTIGDGKGNMKHKLRITEVQPGKKLVHTFENITQPGFSHVTFELFDEGEQTRFLLTHTGLETFPLDTPGYTRENFEGGWGHLFVKSLPAYLEQHS